MREQIEKFFSPCVTLYWRGRFGKQSRHWHPDRIKDAELLRQFISEVGIKSPGFGPMVTTADLDKIGAAASAYGYCLETIGWEVMEAENANHQAMQDQQKSSESSKPTL